MQIDFINVQTRDEFEKLLADITSASIIVADTETNGLSPYRNQIISISVFLPEMERGYNIPFRHGQGVITTSTSSFHELAKWNKEKSELYLDHFYRKYPKKNMGNIPLYWIEELKQVWGKGTYIFHNATFDLHMLYQEGFPAPDIVEDTLLAASLVLEDWRGGEFIAPYKDKAGLWAKDEKGVLKKKKTVGNKQLKWLAAYFDIPNATVGEYELLQAKNEFENELAVWIVENHLYDSYNASLRYKSPNDKQVERIRKKLKISSKAHMWMLPSSKVATYAILDTVLTWFLREKFLEIIEKWNNTELYYNLCDIQLNVTWPMEVTGIKINPDKTMQRFATLQKQAEELQQVAYAIQQKHGLEPFSIASSVKLSSMLRLALVEPFSLDLLPSWVSSEVKAQLTEESLLDVYEEYGLPATDKKALKPYASHPIIWIVSQYRKIMKASNTYLKRWLEYRDSNDVVHPSFNLSGTVTGRLSSSGDSGNFQNIPTREYSLTDVMEARQGNIIFAIDYGQLEARLASWVAENVLPELGAYSVHPTMTELFESGTDIHAYTRDMINVRDIVYEGMSNEGIALRRGATLSEIEDLDSYVRNITRYIAKTLNFGLLYNGTEYMVSNLLNLDLDKSIILVEQWRRLFPAFAKAQNYYTELGTRVRKLPNANEFAQYITQPITGRHRKFHKYPTLKRAKEIYEVDGKKIELWKEFNPRAKAVKKGWNSIVQGLGGWLSVESARRFYYAHTWQHLKLFAQIHDALEGECPTDKLYLVRELTNYMVDYPVIKPNLTIDLEAGYTWLSANHDNPNGLRKVKNIDLWVTSNGELGYS